MSKKTLLLFALGVLTLGSAQAQASQRPHDSRQWQAITPVIAPLEGASLYAGIMSGLQGQQAYAIEVPERWNGMLAVYAHGYAGEGPELRVQVPALREAFIAQGFAWAASSYSANSYDARAGLEDTGRMVSAFGSLTGGKYPEPNKRFLIGVSMGGHIAAAALEKETLESAAYPVRYHAALNLCGVLDPELQFNYLGDYSLLSAYFAGFATAGLPEATLRPKLGAIVERLFVVSPQRWEPTRQGRLLEAATKMLSGGERPVFAQGFRDPRNQGALFSFFGASGDVNGILPGSLYDNTSRVYRSQSGPATAAELLLNRRLPRVSADPDPNPRQAGTVRPLPAVSGEISVPVLSLHTLGDLFVPFSHQLSYQSMVAEQGNSALLVQRAIRASGHCEFSPEEVAEAFAELVRWEAGGPRPAGDDLSPQNVARPDFGCRFTRGVRAGIPACPAP